MWIRPDGRGTFQESAVVKGLVDRSMEAGMVDFVVDLEACPGMDSTFMGMLAGVGIALKKLGRGAISVVGTTEKTRASLEELGVHHVVRIEPVGEPWMSQLAEARADLVPVESGGYRADEDHIRDSHEDLLEVDEENFSRFETLLGMLGSERLNSAQSRQS